MFGKRNKRKYVDVCVYWDRNVTADDFIDDLGTIATICMTGSFGGVLGQNRIVTVANDDPALETEYKLAALILDEKAYKELELAYRRKEFKAVHFIKALV